MIGAHELLLIVRAQNQASAALGRVGADIRRLQAQRDLGRRQSALENQTLQARTRLQSIISTSGAKNLQIQSRRLAIEHQVEAINARTVGLDQRRAAIQVRANNLKLQEVRLEDRLLGLAGKRAAATASIARAEATVMGTQRKIESLQFGGQAYATAHLGVSKARTGIDAATLSQMRATRAFDRIKSAGVSAKDPIYKERELASSIASQRLTQANRSYEIARMGVKALDAQIEHLQITLHGQKSSLIAAQEALTNLNRSEREIKLQIENVTASWDHLNARERAVIATEEQHQRELEQLGARLKIVNAEQKEMGIQASILGHNIKNNLGPDMENLVTERAVQRMERFRTAFAAMGHIGRVVSMGGLVGTAVAGYAAHTAAQFQTQATLAATQMITKSNNSVAQIMKTGAYNQSAALKFLGSGKSVLSSTDVTTAQYEIPSGIPGLRGNSIEKAKQTIAIIKELNQVSKANFGLVDINGLTNAAITLVNTFGTSVARLPREFDVMQSAVNRGKITMGDFVNGLSKTGPAAAAAGYTFDAMAGTLSFLSDKITNYSVVVAGYARSLDVFKNQKFQQYMAGHGHAITDAKGRLLSYLQIIRQMLKVFPDLSTKHGNLIADLKTASGSQTTVQARRTLTVSLKDQAGLAEATKAIPANAQGLINAQATALSKTGAVRWQELTTQIKAFAIEIGTGVIPVVTKLGQFLSPLVKWFQGLSTSTKHAIGYFAAFAGLASLVGGALLTVVGGIGAAVLGMRAVGGSFGIVGGQAKAVEGAVVSLGSEAGFIGTRMALSLGIPAAIFLLIKYHKQVAAVIHALGGMRSALNLLALAFIAFRIAGIVRGFVAVKVAEVAIGDAAEGAAIKVGLLERALISAASLAIGLGAAIELFAFSKTITTPQPVSKGQVRGAPRGTALVTSQGQTYVQTAGGRLTRARRGTVTDAGAASHKAIAQAIADSPRYQHAVGANQARVDAFTAALARQAAQQRHNNALDKGVGAKGHNQGRTVAQWISAVEKAQTAMNANGGSLATAKAFEKVQADLNKRFKDNPALLAAINDVIGNYNSNLKDATNNTQTLGTTTQDVLGKIQSMYDGFKQQEETNFGQLFSGPYVNSPRVQNNLQFGGQLTGKDLVKDYRSQITQFKTLQGQYNKLQRKGAPVELMDQLRAMGPDALKNLKALNTLSKPEINKYFGLFKQGQKLVHDQTMRDLNRQLKQYSKYGKNVALQIVAGLKSEQPAVQNELERIVKKMFPGLPVGKTGAGGKPTHTKQPTHTTINNYNNHTHVVAPKKDHASIKAQLRHADLTLRNKHQGRGGVSR